MEEREQVRGLFRKKDPADFFKLSRCLICAELAKQAQANQTRRYFIYTEATKLPI
jgi:hypothetical protein